MAEILRWFSAQVCAYTETSSGLSLQGGMLLMPESKQVPVDPTDEIDRIVRNWASMPSPIRPSSRDKARYQAAIVHTNLPANAKVLLLGFTVDLEGLN
jgi:hypothetical protein